MSGLILAVSGTRRMLDEKEEGLVLQVLDSLHPRVRAIYVGDCPTGVDWIVRSTRLRYPETIPMHVFEAYWDEEGKRAGMTRNWRMLEAADRMSRISGLRLLVSAFPNTLDPEKSPGTWGAIKMANRMRVGNEDRITVEITPV